MKTKLLLILALCYFGCLAQTVKIGLYWGDNINSLIFTSVYTDYKIYADEKLIGTSDKFLMVQVTGHNDSLKVKIRDKEIHCRKIWFTAFDTSCFKIKSVNPDVGTPKIFDGRLDISSSKGMLKIINHVALDHYVAGVVESEVGTRSVKEYYKTQAIICRTYTLSHLRRHEAEGFELCAKVHCQAYKQKSRGNAEIIRATKETSGMVLVDNKPELITAAFHSNCGGYTANSEDVWSLSLSYLRSVRDTFCVYQPNATWKKEMPLSNWSNYLHEKCKYPAGDSSYCSVLNGFSQDVRMAALNEREFRYPFKSIRNDLGFKSAYFSYSKNDSTMVFHGRGYGHGVGLCQEGAMRMARLGYSYRDILHFYYSGINIIHLSRLEFFRDNN